MLKCCICGKELHSRTLWACGACCNKYALPLNVTRWPAWARNELERERKRRKFEPSYGVSGAALEYTPYQRGKENTTYRKVNRVRKPNPPKPRQRVTADDLLYSSTANPVHDPDGNGHNGNGRHGDPSHFNGLFDNLPAETRRRLLHDVELRVILGDAVRSLPLISQRALRGAAEGEDVAVLAAREGVPPATLEWLLSQAKQRVADILAEKLGADDGSRYS